MDGAGNYHVYLLRCEGGQLYAGITTDLERRFSEHASGGPKGARYTRAHPPVRYEAAWAAPNRSVASALEHRLKRLTRAQKEAVVSDPAVEQRLLGDLLKECVAPRVLMLGNSLTTSHGMPDALSELLGADIAVHARGGARLSEHLNPETKLGAMTQAALAEGGWTHVVLQERSDGPVRFQDAYLRSAAALCEAVRDVGAVPVVYATWAYAPGCPKLAKLGMEHDEMHAKLQSAFNEAADAGGAVMANVGLAFEASSDAASPYSGDGVHPSEAGACLAASEIAVAISAH